MKKILLLLLIIISVNGLAQFPATQSQGTINTKVVSNGGFEAKKGLINGVFADTTAANADYIDFYNGAQIYTRSDRRFWLRDSVLNMWIRMAKFSEVGGNYIFNESVVESNDSVFLSNEKIYPRRTWTGYVDSASIAGWHDLAIVDFTDAEHGFEAWYDTTGTYEIGRGVVKFREPQASCLPQYIKFSTEVDVYAPLAGDSILKHSEFPDKIFTVYRDGAFQHINSLYGYTVGNDTLYFHPPLFENEQVNIKLEDSACSTQLTLEEPPEGSAVDMDFDVGQAVESSANEWDFGAGDYAGNTLTSMPANGYLEFEMPSDTLVIGLDDNSGADFYHGGGANVVWKYG